MDRPILSVAELTAHIKSLLDTDPALGRVLVQGELSNYKIYPSGHHYFTLKDAGASLKCVMFRSDAQKLRFRPENGLSVVCSGRVTVYPRDGAYQLYVSVLQPAGVGELYLAYEQLKKRLTAEGLFDPDHKKALPRMPERIAVITSGAGAAVRDIIRILGSRWPLSQVLVLPVRVQGKEAPGEIVNAIRYANQWQVADLIITGRGGGSMEDLWAFNDELVVRAIYDSQIPVISAVGHEPDVTLSDFAADRRASTPSNGAEIAVPDQQEIRATLLETELRLQKRWEKLLQTQRQRLTDLAGRRVMESPEGFIDQRREDLDRLSHRLITAERALHTGKVQELGRLSAALEAMSPLKVLGRGFSVVTDERGAVLKDANSVEPGDMVKIRMEHGSLRCRVEDRTGEEP